MQSLNLIPNPPVLLTQALIFTANIAIVKKLFVEPYLAVKDRRDKVTIGSKGDATRFITEAESVSASIAKRLESAFETAKSQREVIKTAALQKRDALLQAADKDAKAQIAAVEKQIQTDLLQEKAKIPAVVAQLTEAVYQIALA